MIDLPDNINKEILRLQLLDVGCYAVRMTARAVEILAGSERAAREVVAAYDAPVYQDADTITTAGAAQFVIGGQAGQVVDVLVNGQAVQVTIDDDGVSALDVTADAAGVVAVQVYNKIYYVEVKDETA